MVPVGWFLAELWEVELGDAATQLISAQWLQTSSSLKLLIQILTGRDLSQGWDQNWDFLSDSLRDQIMSERSDQDRDSSFEFIIVCFIDMLVHMLPIWNIFVVSIKTSKMKEEIFVWNCSSDFL